MSLKSILVAALLVGSSTAALAAPSVRDHRWQDATSFDVRDHRTQTVSIREPYRPTYETLAPVQTAPYQAGFMTVGTLRGAFQGTQTIDLGCEGRFVNTLRIYSPDQNNVIWNVTVHYGDGTQYTYLWNHQFNDSTDGQTGPYLRMGVGGKTITRIDIKATKGSRAPMQVQIA